MFVRQDKKWAWFFLALFVFRIFLFDLIPTILSIVFSFTEYNLISLGDFVGLENFKNVFTDPEIFTAYRNTFVFAILYIPLELFISCVLGVALNQRFKSISLFRMLYFIPVLSPMVAVSMIWMVLYNPYGGTFNWLLSLVGLGPSSFVFSTNWFVVIASVAAMCIWKGIGSQAIYVLAALQNISDDVYEAASIDGIGPIRRFFKITIPLISPTIFYLLMIGVIGVLGVFDVFKIMASESSANVDTIGTLMYYQTYIRTDVGQASAIGWVTFFITGTLTIINKKTEKRWVHYD